MLLLLQQGLISAPATAPRDCMENLCIFVLFGFIARRTPTVAVRRRRAVASVVAAEIWVRGRAPAGGLRLPDVCPGEG